MSIKKCISCECAVIQNNYDRITKSVIACRQHHDIFAPECEYRHINTDLDDAVADLPAEAFYDKNWKRRES